MPRRREQLAEILAEGEEIEAHPPAIPESHAKLLDERAALADAGKMERVPGAQVHEELMTLAMGNLRKGLRKRAKTPAKGRGPSRRTSKARPKRRR